MYKERGWLQSSFFIAVNQGDIELNKYVITLTVIEVDCIRLPAHESNDALYFITTLTSPGKSGRQSIRCQIDKCAKPFVLTVICNTLLR